MKDSRSALFDF